MRMGKLLLVALGVGSCFVFGVDVAYAEVDVQATTSAGSAATIGRPSPKDPRTRAMLHTQLGSMYFQDGDLTVALEELTMAASLDPSYAKTFATRAIVLYNVKKYDAADKDFNRALSLDPTDPEINNNYGWYLTQVGRYQDALKYFRVAVDNPLYKTPGMAYINMADCQLQLGALDAAEESLRKGARYQPGNPQALYLTALLSYKRGQFDAAKRYLSELVQEPKVPASVVWLALRVEHKLGNRAAELALTDRLTKNYPDSSEYQAFSKGLFE